MNMVKNRTPSNFNPVRGSLTLVLLIVAVTAEQVVLGVVTRMLRQHIVVLVLDVVGVHDGLKESAHIVELAHVRGDRREIDALQLSEECLRLAHALLEASASLHIPTGTLHVCLLLSGDHLGCMVLASAQLVMKLVLSVLLRMVPVIVRSRHHVGSLVADVSARSGRILDVGRTHMRQVWLASGGGTIHVVAWLLVRSLLKKIVLVSVH